MASEHTVVIVDDDEWKRSGMRQRLDATAEIAVVEAVDEKTAASWPLDSWSEIDTVLVDIFDDRATGEVGTDLYSGISVVERVRRLPVRCIVVTPSCAHPLVQLRLHQAEPDFCYHRFQLAELGALSEALRYPARDHRLPAPDVDAIKSFGARKLLANDVVRTYCKSPLHGKLQSDSGHKALKSEGVSRRAVDRFKDEVVGHGFDHTEADPPGAFDEPPRWPVVRSLVLRLLGRLDAPWSEFDRPWWP